MTKTITIIVDDEHTAEESLNEVARLVSEGYTSGIDPTFDITED